MPSPKYLTGDKEAIKEFVDRFDVSIDSFLGRVRKDTQLKRALHLGLIELFLTSICTFSSFLKGSKCCND